MKNLIPTKLIPCLTVSCAALGLVLRWAMYLTCVDDRGLLVSWNFFQIAGLAVSGVTAVFLILLLLPLDGSNQYRDNFSPSILGALGTLMGAGGILATVMSAEIYPDDRLTLFWMAAGLVSVLCLVAAAVFRFLGKAPFFLLYGAVCVFFALHIANQYQHWSGNPQIQDYSCQLFACIFLMLSAYYQAAFAVGSGKRRAQLFTGLMGVYLCALSLVRGDTPWLFLGGMGWLLTNLCALRPVRRRREDDAPKQPDGSGEPQGEVG